jgi:hypothetical protein
MTIQSTELYLNLKNVNCVSSIKKKGTADGEWEITVQVENVSSVKSINHILWDCKRYEEQRVAMRDILSENRKKEYPVSVTELSRLEGKILL